MQTRHQAIRYGPIAKSLPADPTQPDIRDWPGFSLPTGPRISSLASAVQLAMNQSIQTLITELYVFGKESAHVKMPADSKTWQADNIGKTGNAIHTMPYTRTPVGKLKRVIGGVFTDMYSTFLWSNRTPPTLECASSSEFFFPAANPFSLVVIRRAFQALHLTDLTNESCAVDLIGDLSGSVGLSGSEICRMQLASRNGTVEYQVCSARSRVGALAGRKDSGRRHSKRSSRGHQYQ
ncbi:uncharacterized protein P174DRAFT_499695 [Aspergillus novofumigatus IBT 16806]|uniref:Uncharacterized protein n=1 Tax=Aspergillus novofumigatus (strain IBT 16806) TaxID=1392255 RepID=A0A2I1CJX4_ASPN1|nr:uncharacterized protein P174DRAFT_499695 [Aspergillus novofumigatus IBT 16806]PKX97923.1 hypothetical protein P174DRAFT_499695 [Aspergillus novofumigatus IBT 16806]